MTGLGKMLAAVKHGWRRRTLFHTLGISRKTPFWYMDPTRSGRTVLLDVSMGLNMVRKLMLHLGFLSNLVLLACLGQWKQLHIMLRIILQWLDVDKVEALKRYKFSLAFENCNEEDYVTEMFSQSLVAGTIPVVIGAPDIQEFAPSPGLILHIKEVKDVDSVAKTMKYLAENTSAFNESMSSLTMSFMHSLGNQNPRKDERSPEFKQRPCRCISGSKTIYHVYARERGRFEMESIFLSLQVG